MKRHHQYLLAILTCLGFLVFSQHLAASAAVPPAEYNVVWDEPSKDSSESMPFGGGDTGLNVWVEDGDILFYIQRSGSLAETNEYLKLGRVRLRLEPNPFAAENLRFRQELKLREGYVEIQGRSTDPEGETLDATVRVWVEVHRPVIHLEVESSRKITATASYENWRLEDEMIPNNNRRRSFFSLNNYPDEVKLTRDHVAHTEAGVMFYHRNPGEDTLVEKLIRQQELDDFRSEITDDLRYRTFGGLMVGEGFQPAGEEDGTYQTTAFRAWKLRSEKPARSHHLRVVTHIDQTETLDAWKDALLTTTTTATTGDPAEARERAQAWWAAYWDRSWIIIHPTNPDPAKREWRVGRNYALFRYQLGCNAFGEYPSKFNGGNFTFDANLVGGRGAGFGPDWRDWGGGVFTAQNQRLLHWPMLKAGDFDAILPQFELYRKALLGARARVRAHFDHDGAIFSEYIGVPGLALGAGYGWESGPRKRGEEIPFGDPRADATRGYNDLVEKGVMANPHLSYHWISQIEHAYMILEYHRFTGNDISEYIPFIENAVVFFDEHYRLRQKMRNGEELDENGHLVIHPATAAEAYWGATNPTDVTAGLSACIEAILSLDDEALNLRDKAFYRRMLEVIPPYNIAEQDGVPMIQAAASWDNYRGQELPQFYPLFPFNRFVLGRDDQKMQVFRDTYQKSDFRNKGNVISWHQDGIFLARMGMTEEAADYNFRKLDDSPRRFPTFWGPGHDWVPDHNWGGSGMIGLQEMLMQTIGDEIRLLPAWPADWDVDFKLHAPQQTTVEGQVRDGKLIDLKIIPESRRKDIVIGR